MQEGVIFSDESGHDSTNQYGAICTISGPRGVMLDLHSQLNDILIQHQTKEIKFYKVKSVRHLQIAKKFIDIGIKFINERKIKAHIIVWDKKDSRHEIKMRDDDQNLARMYYHILNQVNRDWKGISIWSFYPDEFLNIDWKDDLVSYLENTKYHQEADLFRELSTNIRFASYKKTQERDSKNMFCIQLADLFAGIVRTSRTKSKEFQRHLKPEMQTMLFKDDCQIEISKNLRPKLELMNYFYIEAGRAKFGVNFSVNKYFTTFSKKTNIFIQHYIPQSEFDKAPIKNSP